MFAALALVFCVGVSSYDVHGDTMRPKDEQNAPMKGYDLLRDYHMKRICVDACTALGEAETEKQMLQYSSNQVSDQVVRYIGDFATESFFCGYDDEQTIALILDLNDNWDRWLEWFAHVRSQLVDFAEPGHHQHSYYTQLSYSRKPCSDEPKNVDEVDRWPFLDEILADFEGLIVRIGDYLSPNSSSSLEYRRNHEDHYAELTNAVQMLGQARSERLSQFASPSDREALHIGISELIRASTYVGDVSFIPTGPDSRRELLLERALSTLLSEIERLLHNL